MFKIYNFFIYILIPFLKLNLYIRANRGKEEKSRINERFGLTSATRPKNNLIWIHASSVGEFNSTTGLIKKILTNNNILLTTSTVSAYHFANKIFKNKIIHQYAPLDHEIWVGKFIDHWQPNYVIWIESDLWPNTLRLINERKISSILLNLRISPKSFRRWLIFKKQFSQLMNYFDKVFVQSDEDLKKISKLTSKKISFIGNLKLTSLPIAINNEKLNKIKRNLVSKKIILIASSHPKEEDLILDNIKGIVLNNSNIFVIIVPRHPSRANEVLNIARKYLPQSILENNNDFKLSTNCMVSNSLGEMPLYFELSDIVILGGSFTNLGGHNPIEPASHNCCIVTGPNIYNWKNIYYEMDNIGACVICKDIKVLNDKINLFLDDKNLQEKFKIMAYNYKKQKKDILENILEYLNIEIENINNAKSS